MASDYGLISSEKLTHLLLCQPNCFIFKANIQTYGFVRLVNNYFVPLLLGMAIHWCGDV